MGGQKREEHTDRPSACLSSSLNSYGAAVFKQTQATRGAQQVLRRGRADPPLIFQLISWDSGEQRSYFLFTQTPAGQGGQSLTSSQDIPQTVSCSCPTETTSLKVVSENKKDSLHFITLLFLSTFKCSFQMIPPLTHTSVLLVYVGLCMYEWL